MVSLAKTVTRNSVVALISKLSVKLVSFAFTIWIVKVMGDAEFGRYALVWSYVTVFAAASDLGLGMYIIREVARGDPNNKYLPGNIIVLRLILAAITLLLIGLTAYFIGYSAQLVAHIYLASTILLLYAVQDPLDSVLQANERVDISSVLRIGGQLIFVVLGFAFLRAGWGITGLIIASLSNVLISALLAWHIIQRRLGGIEWHIRLELWPRLLVVALPFGITAFALNWSQKIDTVILSLFWPEEVLGWYNAAYSLILGLVVISNSFNIALYPSISKEFVSDLNDLVEIQKRIFKFLFMASLPLAFGLAILSRPIILTLYGVNFSAAILALAILAWLLPLIFISEYLRYTAFAMGKEKIAAWATVLASLANIVLNLLLVPRNGLIAAAAVAVFTEALLVLLYWRPLRARFCLPAIAEVFWKPALAAALMSVVLLLTRQASLILTVALGSGSYMGILFLLGGIGSEEREFMRKMLERTSPVAPPPQI